MFLIFFYYYILFHTVLFFCDSIFAFTFLWKLIPCIAIHKLGWLQNVNWKKSNNEIEHKTAGNGQIWIRNIDFILYLHVRDNHNYTFLYIYSLVAVVAVSFFSFGNSLWINTTWNSCREYTNECNIYQQKRLKQRINKLCSLNSMHGNNDGRKKTARERNNKSL